MALDPTLAQVTARIQARSASQRQAYLAAVQAYAQRPPGSQRLGCANVAHALAAVPEDQRRRIVRVQGPHIAIVNAYNDILSAHQPLGSYPELLKDEARRCGASAQVAAGVPAMCDGVTQGMPGMELSLFSRDTIAMATAIALSHDMFDGALLLGVCDKIVPGLLIGALHFGHLPCVFVPAGPMPSGLSNNAKARLREQAAQGLIGRSELLEAEQAAYHAPGTCTFYGTANSNQMLLEAMGLHVPGSAFVPPGTALREALTRQALRTVLAITRSARYTPIGQLVDERAIVNAMVALLATGGSTNHLIHWVAVARAAGIHIDWDDFDALSQVVPLLARVYPNGDADVNQLQAAGGPALVLRELLAAGLLHPDVLSVAEGGLSSYTTVPALSGPDAVLHWSPVGESGDRSVVRSRTDPFSPSGGIRLLQGNLGRSVIKISAVPPERHRVQAPARVFDGQEQVLAAFTAGELECDFVCVVRWQGPRANGMPELHKLTPVLSILQARGFEVALVTDGRMSGASGKVPEAIHLWPEAFDGGPLARLRDGDLLCLDAGTGRLDVLLEPSVWAARLPTPMPPALLAANGQGLGRELFAGLRQRALPAEQGACTWL